MNPNYVDPAAQTAMYGGGAGALTLWGFGLSDIAAIISALVAVGGFALHVVMTLERRKREKELHALTVAQLQGRLVKVD